MKRGLYSVVSYTVAQRVNEFGIRLALGAQSGHVMRIVFASVLASVSGRDRGWIGAGFSNESGDRAERWGRIRCWRCGVSEGRERRNTISNTGIGYGIIRTYGKSAQDYDRNPA